MKNVILFFSALFFLTGMILLDSCKCKDTEDLCPDCGENEECIDGVCDCVSSTERLWGVCQFKTDTSRSESYLYPMLEACFGFDSCFIRFNGRFYENLTDDTSTSLIFANQMVVIGKYDFQDPEQDGVVDWGATVRRSPADGLIHIEFTLQGQQRFDEMPTLRGWTRGYKMRTRWDCVFSEDIQSMDVHIYLQEDQNRDDKFTLPEEEVDSCVVHTTLF